jgi:uncharacterized protein YfeS
MFLNAVAVMIALMVFPLNNENHSPFTSLEFSDILHNLSSILKMKSDISPTILLHFADDFVEDS